MNNIRTEAISKVLADLDSFQIDHQAYFDDAALSRRWVQQHPFASDLGRA